MLMLCYITSILESRRKYVWCSENFNMQFSGRQIVQIYIDTFVYFLHVYQIPNPQGNYPNKFNLIKRKQLTPNSQTLHPVLHHELRTNEFGTTFFPPEEGRYSEHIVYCNTFYITQQYLWKLVCSFHWGSKLRVPIVPRLVEFRSS